MSLSVGIVGLPNVGKSTLFTALTKNEVLIANYPFATIDPSVGVVAVPDGRLKTLSAISGSQKIIPAIVEFVDIAGLVKGASKGEGLGNKFLANIREVDAILEMVRIFPLKEDNDKEVIREELTRLFQYNVWNEYKEQEGEIDFSTFNPFREKKFQIPSSLLVEDRKSWIDYDNKTITVVQEKHNYNKDGDYIGTEVVKSKQLSWKISNYESNS